MKEEGSNRPSTEETIKRIIQSLCWCPYSVPYFITGMSEGLKIFRW